MSMFLKRATPKDGPSAGIAMIFGAMVFCIHCNPGAR